MQQSFFVFSVLKLNLSGFANVFGYFNEVDFLMDKVIGGLRTTTRIYGLPCISARSYITRKPFHLSGSSANQLPEFH
jgi:hypothetical protein